MLPRYGERSLAEVPPALLTALGVPGPEVGPVLPPVRAVGLLLVDGLGAEQLRAHATDAPFLAGLADAGPLTVGFPSSTSTSLASLGTGLPPGCHGIVGITFRTGGELLDSLHWTRHAAGKTVDLRKRLPPEQVQPMPTELERAAADGVQVAVVSSREFRDSGLTRAALRGGTFQGVHALGDLAAAVIGALTGPDRRLCYGYHADLDSLGHEYGPGSLPWRLQLRQVDLLVATIAEQLPSDALLAVTGDHGMVSINRRYDADTDSELRADVTLLGGDARARHVYTRDGAAPDVLATWRAVLGEDAWVVPGEQAVAQHWFGPLAGHAADRIGDVVVALRGTAAVVRSVVEPKVANLTGQHGSLTAAEQLVPLLVTHRG